MNNHTAKLKNLHFIGTYNFNKDVVMERLCYLRKEYPKCKFYLINEDGGYSIYADKLYDMIISKKELEEFESRHASTLIHIQNEYDKKINELNVIRENRLKRIAELEKSINEYGKNK